MKPSKIKRVVRRIAMAILICLLAAVGLLWYFMPVPISATHPTRQNDVLREELLSARKVIFVGAHPDDIEFYCGGTIVLMRERETEVVFALATRGGKGRKGDSANALERRRTRDQEESARILGGVRVIFFDYPDKALPKHVEEFARDLTRLISREQPDVVLSWDPDSIYNPHPDHQAAADAVRIAAEGQRLCYYGTREPDLWVEYNEDTFQTKLKSLRAHGTETPWYFWILQKRFVTKKMAGEGAKIDAPYAETYRTSDF